MSVAVTNAIETVRAFCTDIGIDTTIHVVADRSNLVLRVEPVGGAPFIARVAMATSLVRVGTAWLAREVEISRLLDARGAKVTRPTKRLEPGPHERNGFVLSFWELEELVAERAEPREAGKRLAEIHRALGRGDAPRLPEWGAIEEARAVLARVRTNGLLSPAELLRLERAWEDVDRVVSSARSRTASFQPVHGDAHIGNVLATARGAVWTDWEDAFIGPVELDIACLRSKADLFGEEKEAIERMTAAYDGPYDHQLVRELGLVRNAQVIVWLAIFAERQPELLPRMRARIERLP